MNLLNNDHMRELIASAEKQGFRLEHKTKHFVLIPSDKSKKIVSLSGTSSDINQFWEVRRKLKKSGWLDDIIKKK